MNGAINEMIKSFGRMKSFNGELSFKGDKSISHRALILSAMASGESTIRNLSDAGDVLSTINCLRDLGTGIARKGDMWNIQGKGFKGFHQPEKALNAGNSGTTARLMTGLLAAQDFESVITGDMSLSIRPMDRVINPLSLMGAHIKSEKGKLPLGIHPVKELKAARYEMETSSAQVKSSIILAGLHCMDETQIIEKIPTRNHTEIMLNLPVERSGNGNLIKVSQKYYPEAKDYFIPGDISSASFFIILTLLTTESNLVIRNILLNSSRTGLISILKEMGGDIQIVNKENSSGEEYGDIIVKASRLVNVNIPESLIPGIIDEIPALTIAGIFAEADFSIRNASELRYKESDRIRALVDNLNFTDLSIREYTDGFTVEGKTGNSMPVFDSLGDHRIAMTFILLSLLLDSGGSIIDPECISISNPDFLKQIEILQSNPH